MNLRGILLDMDGVLYNEDAPIPSAAETIRWLESRRVPFLFVTNTSSRGREALAAKLRRFGIETEIGRIHTPCVAASAWLAAQAQGPVALFVKEAAEAEFTGLALVSPLVSPLDSKEALATCGAVVIGDLGDAWSYETLNRAFRLLQYHPNARLIALGMTRYWQASGGLCLDVGPYVAALEYATGRAAMIFGKPASEFFHAAAGQLQLPAQEILMVGDDIRMDVGGARAAGMRAALVQTGKYRSEDVAGDVAPDLVIGSIADLPEWWEKNAVSGAAGASGRP